MIIPIDDVALIVRANWRGAAQRIAEKYSIPVPTARRWIYTARVRGALPPGKCPTCGRGNYARS